mmetsp:Transcript_50288/g.121067  ORF Transcript_50288/g.121067 Transcript_50288/m.121067 type:complete len:202 (-) Transcript_50288:197-802(-)
MCVNVDERGTVSSGCHREIVGHVQRHRVAGPSTQCRAHGRAVAVQAESARAHCELPSVQRELLNRERHSQGTISANQLCWLRKRRSFHNFGAAARRSHAEAPVPVLVLGAGDTVAVGVRDKIVAIFARLLGTRGEGASGRQNANNDNQQKSYTTCSDQCCFFGSAAPPPFGASLQFVYLFVCSVRLTARLFRPGEGRVDAR